MQSFVWKTSCRVIVVHLCKNFRRIAARSLHFSGSLGTTRFRPLNFRHPWQSKGTWVEFCLGGAVLRKNLVFGDIARNWSEFSGNFKKTSENLGLHVTRVTRAAGVRKHEIIVNGGVLEVSSVRHAGHLRVPRSTRAIGSITSRGCVPFVVGKVHCDFPLVWNSILWTFNRFRFSLVFNRKLSVGSVVVVLRRNRGCNF